MDTKDQIERKVEEARAFAASLNGRFAPWSVSIASGEDPMLHTALHDEHVVESTVWPSGWAPVTLRIRTSAKVADKIVEILTREIGRHADAE